MSPINTFTGAQPHVELSQQEVDRRIDGMESMLSQENAETDARQQAYSESLTADIKEATEINPTTEGVRSPEKAVMGIGATAVMVKRLRDEHLNQLG